MTSSRSPGWVGPEQEIPISLPHGAVETRSSGSRVSSGDLHQVMGYSWMLRARRQESQPYTQQFVELRLTVWTYPED